MTEGHISVENEVSMINVESVIDSFSTFIEQGTNNVMTLLTSNEVANTFEDIKEIGEDLSKSIKVFRTIRKIASIPDKLFMLKVERYCAGVSIIPIEKRKKYLKKMGKKSLNKDSVFVLGILNRNEELSKIDIFIRLLEAKIDDQMYHRLMLQVDRTMFLDILYLKENIGDEDIKIMTVEQENLLAMGWLIFVGIGWGTATEEGENIYKYTQTAKKFCEIVFNS